MEFIIDNIVYIGLALGSALALLWPMLTNTGAGVPSISPAEAVLVMNRTKLLVLDVRGAAEFSGGHIKGAKHIPAASLEARIKELAKQKNKPILVVCQRGVRSSAACKVLATHEFKQVSSLQGGLDKWVDAKMPLVKG